MIYKQNFKTKTMATTRKQFEALEYRTKLNNCLKNIILTSDITCLECHKHRSSEVSCDLAGFVFFGVLFFILVIKTIKKRESFGYKNIIAGIILGVPNYYSIIFLIKALQNKNFESSTLFTINNVAIVVVSTLVGLFFFKEKFSVKNKIGVAMAVLAIILVTIA